MEEDSSCQATSPTDRLPPPIVGCDGRHWWPRCEPPNSFVEAATRIDGRMMFIWVISNIVVACVISNIVVAWLIAVTKMSIEKWILVEISMSSIVPWGSRPTYRWAHPSCWFHPCFICWYFLGREKTWIMNSFAYPGLISLTQSPVSKQAAASHAATLRSIWTSWDKQGGWLYSHIYIYIK